MASDLNDLIDVPRETLEIELKEWLDLSEPSAKPAGDAVGEERTDTAPEARAEAGLAPVIIDILSALAIMAGVEMIETCVARQLASHRGSTAPGAA